VLNDVINPNTRKTESKTQHVVTTGNFIPRSRRHIAQMNVPN
jgi:hypothetical protein